MIGKDCITHVLDSGGDPVRCLSTGISLVVTVVEIRELGEVVLHVLDFESIDSRVDGVLVARSVVGLLGLGLLELLTLRVVDLGHVAL